jgi:hypothetical protein
MIAHPYEYRFFIEYLNPKTASIDFTKQQEQFSFISKISQTANNIPQVLDNLPDGEGWMVLSHSLTFVGTTGVLSILLRRNRR